MANSSVPPSGGAFSANSVPILVLAPGRLSTTNGCPSFSDSHCPIKRATMSGEPPAPVATIKRTGRAG
jgi:hypothetical protein